MRQTILTLAFFLSAIGSFGQNSILDCKAFTFGDFVADNPQDSVYIFRDFSSWYELHTQKGFRNTFNVIWTDECHFSLVFESCSAKDKSLWAFRKGDTLSYNAVSLTHTSITFSVTANTKTYQQMLSRQDGLDVWEYMLTRDVELKADSSFREDAMAVFLPDSIRKNLPNLRKQLMKASFHQAEAEQVVYVLSLLKQSDISPINAIASDDFKRATPPAAMADFNEYLRNAYGKLVSYTVIGRPVNMSSLYGVTVSPKGPTYVLDATFEKVSGNVQVRVALTNDSTRKIQTLNVQAGKSTTVPFIESLTKDFWSNLKDKEFKKIYKGSAQVFKDQATYAQVKTLLSVIESTGQLDSYKLSSQQFATEGGIGFISIQYLLEKDHKKIVLSLNYTRENGDYKLAGLYYTYR